MYIIYTLVAIYILSIVFVRVRNKDKFSLTRQLSDFSTFMVIFNLPAYLLSKVPIQPFSDIKYYPELQKIEDNWEVIRDEAMALYDGGYVGVGEDLPASGFYKNGRWKSFYLKSFSNKIPSAYELAPKTMALIDQVPSMHMALFAVLMPGKDLKKHHDPFAFTLRYSLGLSTPNSSDCCLVVDGLDMPWEDGKSYIFDETYMHSVYNNTDQIRIILMTDVDRPLYAKIVQKIYYHFGAFFNRLFAVDNVDSKYSGIGNKLGKGILAYSAMLKKFKHKNKPLYVLTKLTVTFSILGFIAYQLI
ncbi:MAG: aspartyl/asparaginyl beta-hydroxylase domain-containing protein [Gammaproteobacteria bacterium]